MRTFTHSYCSERYGRKLTTVRFYEHEKKKKKQVAGEILGNITSLAK